MNDVYNKLVRDKIPAIILAQGDAPVTRILDAAAYERALHLKLQEEMTEYLDGFSVGELADVLEVIHAIIESKGLSFEAVEEVRQRKRDECGGFQEKIFLVEVERKNWVAELFLS